MDGPDPDIAAWAASESYAALDAALRTIPADRFVNHPDANRRAERKPLMLQAAARSGLSVPPWLVTNDGRTARRFVETQGATIVKALVAGRIDHRRSLWTTQVQLDDLAGFGPEPYLLQRFVPRAFDVRVTVFDQECVAVRIDADDPTAITDWRQASADAIAYSPCELPPREERALQTLVEAHNLRFAAADFAVDATGSWWFLEINPNGQWAWLEERTNVDLTARLVRMLTT